MSLNLNDWSEIVIKYYIKNPYSLYITLDDLVEGAKAHDPEFNYLITRTFAQALYKNTGTNLTPNSIAKGLKSCWVNQPEGADLCVLALLVCACEYDAQDVNRQHNYYDRLKVFLSSREIGYHLIGEPNFNQFFSKDNLDLEGLINKANTTLAKKGINLHVKLKTGALGRKRYTETIMSQCLINGTIISRFKQIFGDSGFSPLYTPSDDELLLAFKNHHREININDDDAKSILNERDRLTSALRKAFSAWDGTTTVKIKEKRNGRTTTKTQVGVNVESVILAIDSTNVTNVKISAYIYSDCDLESNVRKFKYKDTNDVDCEFNTYLRNGISKDSISPFDPTKDLTLVDDENNCKAVYKVKPYYLLENNYGTWIESLQLQMSGSYLLMVKSSEKDSVLQQLGNSKTNNFTGFNCPLNGYELLQIDSLAQLPTGSKGRKKQPKPIIENFTYGTGVDGEKIVVPDANNKFIVTFPTTVSKAWIRATDETQEIFDLTVNKERGELDCQSNHFHKQWELYVDSVKAFDFTFHFDEAKMASNIVGMSLNVDGAILADNQNLGLQLNQKDLYYGSIAYATKIAINNSRAALPQNTTRPNPSEADKLLYALSAMSYRYFTIKDVQYAAKILAPSLLYCYNLLLNDWYAMGYINMGHDDTGQKIVVNSPTLLLLVPEYQAVEGFELNATISTHFTCLLIGARDEKLIDSMYKWQANNPNSLTIEITKPSNRMPHTVLLHAKSLDVFKAVAKDCKLLFQPTIFASVMMALLPSVTDYKDEAKKRPANFGGKPLTYDIKKIADDLAKNSLKAAVSYKNKKSQTGTVGFELYTINSQQVGVMTEADGSSYHVGRNWGLWIQAADLNKALAVDGGNNTLIVPGVTPLPRIYQRALCLISGQLPSYDSTRRVNVYRLINNPTYATDSVTAQSIIEKLK